MFNKLNQKSCWTIIIILSLGVVFFIISSFLIEPKVVKIIPLTPQISAPIEENEVTIILVGDIMLNRGVKYMIDEYGDGNHRFPFLKIADYLKTADIIFGNLESPISDKGTKVGSTYSFRVEPEAIEGLTFAGFDLISLANNHTFDYGRTALEDCLNNLSNAGINYVGAGLSENEAYSPILKGIKDTKIAFLAYTNLGPKTWQASEENSGVAWISENDFKKIGEDIKAAKENSDILIVSLHAGEEYQEEPTQFQVNFAKMAINSGADLVVGHHPHVTQSIEKYKEGYIVYSLGNFVFDQSFSEETMKGLSLEVIIENNKIRKVVPVNIQINKFFQPELAEKVTETGQFQVSLSATLLKQGDALLIKIPNLTNTEEIDGWFGITKINFFQIEEILIGIVGIDAKEKLGTYKLTINLPDDYQIEEEINIAKREFPITELLVTKELEEKGFSPSKIEENIAKENMILNEVLDAFTPGVYFNQSFIHPLDKIKDVGAFGNIRKSGEISLQHLGVDLEADIGTPVYAINDGVVRLSRDFTNYGKTIVIDHGLGIFSLYLHLDEFKVFEEKEVKRGDIIALSGNTGYSIAPHLHLGVKIRGASVDPLRFIETTLKEME